MIRKLVLNDGRSERELVLKGTLVVGRDPSCHVNDLDPLLSRRHAEFVSGLQGVIVRDLGSRNGILVNGVKVPEQVLSSGDVVQLGHLELRYIEDTTVQAAEHHARAHATTASSLAPTMAPPARPQPPARPVPAAVAPTESMPSAPVQPSPAMHDDDATGVFAATMAPAGGGPSMVSGVSGVSGASGASGASVVSRKNSDDDETRAPGTKPRAALDLDATVAPSAVAQSLGKPAPLDPASIDETRMPLGRSAPPSAIPWSDTRASVPEARMVADRSLIVTEASGGCTAMLGLRPETVIGGQLTEALARALSFVAGGQGPSPLTVSVTRGASNGSLTITFKAGQA